MEEFKEGQQIRMKVGCSGCEKGKIYTLGINTFGSNIGQEFILTTIIDPEVMEFGCSCQRKWEHVNLQEFIGV